jgi:hypothetical protein
MDSDNDDDFVALLGVVTGQQLVLLACCEDSDVDDNEAVVDHRTLPRICQKFDHERALYCIMSDYLGQGCHYYDKEFKRLFMVSCGRFKSIAQKLVVNDPKFYSGN